MDNISEWIWTEQNIGKAEKNYWKIIDKHIWIFINDPDDWSGWKQNTEKSSSIFYTLCPLKWANVIQWETHRKISVLQTMLNGPKWLSHFNNNRNEKKCNKAKQNKKPLKQNLKKKLTTDVNIKHILYIKIKQQSNHLRALIIW